MMTYVSLTILSDHIVIVMFNRSIYYRADGKRLGSLGSM